MPAGNSTYGGHSVVGCARETVTLAARDTKPVDRPNSRDHRPMDQDSSLRSWQWKFESSWSHHLLRDRYPGLAEGIGACLLSRNTAVGIRWPGPIYTIVACVV